MERQAEFSEFCLTNSETDSAPYLSLTVFLLLVTVLPGFRKHLVSLRGLLCNFTVWFRFCLEDSHHHQKLQPPLLTSEKPLFWVIFLWEWYQSVPCTPLWLYHKSFMGCLSHQNSLCMPNGFLFKWRLSVLCKSTWSQPRWETAVIKWLCFNCCYHITLFALSSFKRHEVIFQWFPWTSVSPGPHDRCIQSPTL